MRKNEKKTPSSKEQKAQLINQIIAFLEEDGRNTITFEEVYRENMWEEIPQEKISRIIDSLVETGELKQEEDFFVVLKINDEKQSSFDEFYDSSEDY